MLGHSSVGYYSDRYVKKIITMERWKRPENVPVGKVWTTFRGIGRDGKPGQVYQVRDLEESHKKKAVDMMKEVYLKEEPLSVALGISQDPASLMFCVANWEYCISQNVSLACFTEVDGKPQDMVGVDVLFVLNEKDNIFKNEDLQDIPGKAWTNMLTTVLRIKNSVKIFNKYKVDKYVTSMGMVVLPEYRRQTIAQNMLGARIPLCNAIDVKLSAIIFTAIPSQKLATNSGYSLLTEFEYKEMLARGIDLSTCTTPSAKFMAIKYQLE